MNIAIYISGHGYGHFTRTLEIIRELSQIDPAMRCHTRMPFSSLQVSDTLGFMPESHSEIRLDVGLVQKDSLESDFSATIEALEYYYGDQGNRLVEQEAEWLHTQSIDCALIDISPRAFDACAIAGVPAFGMSNFSWDWIWRDLVALDSRFERFADEAARSYSTCKRLFRTVMSGGMQAFPFIEDVPLVARISSRSKDEVRSILNLSTSKSVVMLSFGGEGLQDSRFDLGSLHKDFAFVTTEPLKNPGTPFVHLTDERLHQAGLRYCDLVKAADVVISKPGYSTVAECVANQTAILLTERSRFAEYRCVMNYVVKNLPFGLIEQERFLRGIGRNLWIA